MTSFALEVFHVNSKLSGSSLSRKTSFVLRIDYFLKSKKQQTPFGHLIRLYVIL